MKTKQNLKNRFWLTFALLAAVTVFSAAALAQQPPRPGIPGAGAAYAGPGMVNPTTGLPMPVPAPEWQDPEGKLAEVTYDGVPVSEVARDLRQKFKDAFDLVIPNTWQSPNATKAFDPASVPVKIKLKNVSASEVFNAMNITFETENTPLRWELRMNGTRPTAILRVIPALLSAPFAAENVAPPKRMIYFVGELLGGEKSGGMSMEQLVKTVSEVYDMSYGGTLGGSASRLQFHKEAQLLIATGTVDEINFVQQTIGALKQKIDRQRVRPKQSEGDSEEKSEPKPSSDKKKNP